MGAKTKTAKKKVGERSIKPAKPVSVPKSREEAAEFVHQVGERQRELEAIAADAESRIAVIQKEVTEKAEPHQDVLNLLVDGLYLYFTANHEELTQNGKRKSVDLGTGTIGEHINPHKVELTKKKEAVLANIKELGLKDLFIRTAEDINREVMLESEENKALAATVRGVRVLQEKEFRVKPHDTLKEVVADEARLKRRVAA